MNIVKLSGRVGNINYYENKGKVAFAKVALATQSQYTNQNGEKIVLRTIWHHLHFFGDQVAVLKQQLGNDTARLSVSGKLSYDVWTSEKDEKHRASYIAVQKFEVNDRQPIKPKSTASTSIDRSHIEWVNAYENAQLA